MRFLIATLVLLLSQMPSSGSADDPAIRFHRVMVPKDRVQDWPKGSGRYLPLDATLFERLLQATKPRDALEVSPPTVAIAAAKYEAKLSDNGLVGHAAISVALSGSVAMLSLDPCNLAIGEAQWTADGEARVQPTGKSSTVSALLGTAADGRLRAMVERSGLLRFDWSLVGHRDAADVLTFMVELPAAPANELSVELPIAFEPSVDRGLVARSEPTDHESRRWYIELGGNQSFRLQILPVGTIARRPQLALLREARTYEIAPRGIELSVQWRLQIHNEPLRQITAVVDDGMNLTSAYCGDVAVPMSVLPANDGTGTRILLSLPESIRDAERTVRLNLVGPVKLHEQWRLPAVRAEGLFWQEGTISLLLPEPIEIGQVDPIHCVQTAVGPLSGSRTGESLQFQAFGPAATVAMSLVWPTPTLKAFTVSNIEVAKEEVVANVTTSFVVSGTVYGQLHAHVAHDWNIDAVESEPVAAVADWTVEPQNPKGHQLTVRLHPAISPKKPLKLSVRISRPFPLSTEKLKYEDFAPIRFQGATGLTQLAAIESPSGCNMVLAGDRRLKRIQAIDLTADERQLVSAAPVGLLFEVGPNATPLTVAFVEGRDESKSLAVDQDSVLAAEGNPPVATCRVEAWYQPDGASRHQATWDVPGDQLSTASLRLPKLGVSEQLSGLWVDREPVNWQADTGADRTRISLVRPVGEPLSSLRVEWVASGPRLGLTRAIEASLPALDSIEQTVDWTVWLPPGYECVSEHNEPWTARMFSVLRRWLTVPGDTVVPSATGDGGAGWSRHVVRLRGEVGAELRVVHRATMQLLGTVTLLVVATVAVWRCPRTGIIAVFAFLFAVAAIAVPGAYAPLASGAMVGAGIAFSWRLFRCRLFPPRGQDLPCSPSSIHSLKSALTSTGRIVLVFLAISIEMGPDIAGLAAAESDSPRSGASANPAPIYKVLVPIDDEKKPVGGVVHVPESLYQELYRRRPAEESNDYLILGATYRATLDAEGPSRRLSVKILKAQFDVQVFTSSARIRLPSGGNDANLSAGMVLVDGRPVEPRMDADSASFVIDGLDPGRYRLEMPLRVASSGESSGFDVAIPRVAQSRLELSLPADVGREASLKDMRVEVPSAAGTVRIDGNPPLLVAELGPTERLIVRWGAGAASASASPEFDVDEYLWLKIRPGSVVLSTKLRLHVLSGSLQQVRLAVDPRMRLLPLPGNNPPSITIIRDSGESRLFAFQSPQPLGERAELDATFLLTGATGVGTFHIPAVSVLDANSRRRWMAISVDPALGFKQNKRNGLETLRVTEFLRLWRDGSRPRERGAGPEDPPPLAAYRLASAHADWFVSTKPQVPRSTVQTRLKLGYGRQRTDVVFEANVSTTSGYLFQYRLKGPAELKIKEISLFEEDINRVSRWSQDGAGVITVFLNGATTGTQELVLRGQLPSAVGQTASVPHLELQGCDAQSTEVHVFCRPNVRVSVDGVQKTGVVGPSSSGKESESELGLPVANWSCEGSRPPTVNVTTEAIPEPSTR